MYYWNLFLFHLNHHWGYYWRLWSDWGQGRDAVCWVYRMLWKKMVSRRGEEVSGALQMIDLWQRFNWFFSSVPRNVWSQLLMLTFFSSSHDNLFIWQLLNPQIVHIGGAVQLQPQNDCEVDFINEVPTFLFYTRKYSGKIEYFSSTCEALYKPTCWFLHAICSLPYNRLFKKLGLGGILAAKDYEFVDNGSQLLGGIIDKNCGQHISAPVTEVFTTYVDVIQNIYRRHGEAWWTK